MSEEMVGGGVQQLSCCCHAYHTPTPFSFTLPSFWRCFTTLRDNPDPKIPDFDIQQIASRWVVGKERRGDKREKTRRRRRGRNKNTKKTLKSSLFFQQIPARRGEDGSLRKRQKYTTQNSPKKKIFTSVNWKTEKDPNSQKREWVQHNKKMDQNHVFSVSSSTISKSEGQP